MTTTNYPGNPSLPSEVRERVESTFRHSIDSYHQGRLDDTIAGCELILKMDASFDPAKKLMEKAKNPASPIDVSSLLAADFSAQIAEAHTALALRDFERTVDLCNEILAADRNHVEAQKIAEEAIERMEAAPFAQQFISAARGQIANGNASAARSSLEKARSLDPHHPDILALDSELNAPASTGFDFGGPVSSFGSAFGAGSPAAGAPASSSSFVVENAPPASSAPPSDFGFTFEEEKKPDASAGAFSFEPESGASSFASPGAELPVGEGATFDFTTAAVEVSADDQAKIDRYLADGDDAFARGEYASATDAWSRIFLIDVTNEAASQRIEKARVKRLEVDQKVDALVGEGTLAFDRKDLEGARDKFTQALALDPGSSAASDYLERLADAESFTGIPQAPAARRDLLDEDFGSMPSAEVDESDAVPKAKLTSKPKASAVAAAETKPSKTPLLIAAAVGLVILLAAGWFAVSKFSSGEPEFDEAQTRAVFNEADSLARRGKYDAAIQSLQKLPPDHPQQARALEMMADFKKKKAAGSGLINGRPATQVYAERLTSGRTAFAQNDFVAAKRWFEQAAAIRALPPDEKVMYETASQQVAKLDSAMVFFKEGNYVEAIRALEVLLVQDPTNLGIQRLLSNAHFNLGALALQEERTKDAMTEFALVLAAEPGDPSAKRSRDLAERYDNQPKDLLYRIYVRHLPLR